MAGMVLFDTHAHLHVPEYADDLDAVLARAREAGVRAMVTIGTERESNRAAVAMAAAHPRIWATVGIHPHDSAQAVDGDFDEMERLARSDPRVVALGEMGLDFHFDHSPRDVQAVVLRRQLELARHVGKPVVLHCRDAHDEILAILAEARVEAGVMHCFSADVAVARRCLDLGLLISLAGPVTYKNARALPDVARFVPGDRVVIETDCPYLPPTPHRGKRNEPAWVALTARHVAGLRGEDPEAFAAQTSENGARLFGIAMPPDG
jgi:TatD DNase family protein